MCIYIIQKAELTTISQDLLKQAFLIKVHHNSDVDTLLTDEPLGEFHDMLTELQGLLSVPTDAKWKNG